MAHIANCMRRTLEKTDSVYIMEETLTISPTVSRLLVISRMSSSISQPLTNVAKTVLSPKEVADYSVRSPAKYNLWPRPPKTQVLPGNPNLSSDRTMALSAGRSPTALSDTSVNLQKNAGFWRNGGSLSNRRKISVPELGSQPRLAMGSQSSIDSRKSS
jgi:hypothetical protein